MDKVDAEEFTKSLGQIVGGSMRQIELADKLGVPKALGMKLPEWVNEHLGGYAKLAKQDRIKLILEYKQEEKLSNVKIAQRLGVDESTIRNDLASENSENEIKKTSKNTDDLDESSENSEPTTKAARTRTAHEQIAKFAFDRPAAPVPGGDAIRLGDFYELSAEIKDDTVDLIFTDPPYDDESLKLFDRMGEVAARILKPGASLVTYLGHMQILEAGRLLSKHIRFWHPLCCMHAGPFARMTEYGVIESFKPMLWFVKGTRSDKHTFITSAISGAREKDHHEWQQAESEAAYFIENLSPKGGLVVDFFAGGGTTIVAAMALGRLVIGYEIEKRHWIKANDRIRKSHDSQI